MHISITWFYSAAGDTWNLQGYPVRLTGGESHFEGRVEILYRGVWGTVCHNKWDLLDSHVVCHQLGFGPALQHSSVMSKYAGLRKGPILLNNVQCAGKESSLANCSHDGWNKHNCVHNQDVVLKCSGRKQVLCSDCVTMHILHVAELSKPTFELRLTGGATPNSGIVEVYYGGVWGTVCSDYWNMKNAAVVCKQLGYPTALSTSATIVQSFKGTKLTWFDSVNCTGQENQLGECQLSGWGKVIGCPAGHVAKTTCKRKNSHIIIIFMYS